MNKCFTNVASSDHIMYHQTDNQQKLDDSARAGKRLIPLHLENFG